MQLGIYAVAWLVVGLGFGLNRGVAGLWSAGWFSGMVATALVFLGDRVPGPFRDLITNTFVVVAFSLIQEGVARYTRTPSYRGLWVALGVGLVLIEWLRLSGGELELVRVCLFTLVACAPLALTSWTMVNWLRTARRAPLWQVGVMVAPVVLTIGVFGVRALAVLADAPDQVLDFGASTNFAVSASVLFLFLLGAFNFSLASLVVGSVIERLRTLSETDQLSGLFNRRVMMRRLAEEHARFLRSAHVYALVMIDVDYFKQVNDRHGHTVGDQVLQGLARELERIKRSTDTLARTGGEEFMLLMPLTDADGAATQARRICEAVSRTPLATDAGPLPVSLSLGVAEVVLSDQAPDAVVLRADAALYQAKALGRNRVEQAPRVAMPS